MATYDKKHMSLLVDSVVQLSDDLVNVQERTGDLLIKIATMKEYILLEEQRKDNASKYVWSLYRFDTEGRVPFVTIARGRTQYKHLIDAVNDACKKMPGFALHGFYVIFVVNLLEYPNDSEYKIRYGDYNIKELGNIPHIFNEANLVKKSENNVLDNIYKAYHIQVDWDLDVPDTNYDVSFILVQTEHNIKNIDNVYELLSM